jgi:hypothetical protein
MQPPIRAVPHAHEPTSGSIRIGSHFTSARIANLEPTNCFAAAETERKAREVIVHSGDLHDADAARQKASEALDFLMTNSRVKSA